MRPQIGQRAHHCPAGPGLGPDTHGAGEYEAASPAHPDPLAGSADAPEHDPGTIAIH